MGEHGGKKWLFCLLPLVKIGVFLDKCNPASKSLITICLQLGGMFSCWQHNPLGKTIEPHYFTSIDWTYWHFRFVVASVSMAQRCDSQSNWPEWHIHYHVPLLPSGYLVPPGRTEGTAWNLSEGAELCGLRDQEREHVVGASLMSPRTGCRRELCGALLFKNLRSSLDTNLAYFPYNNRFQGRPLLSLGYVQWLVTPRRCVPVCVRVGDVQVQDGQTSQNLPNLYLIKGCVRLLPKEELTWLLASCLLLVGGNGAKVGLQSLWKIMQ